MNRELQISKTLYCDVLVVGAGGAGMRCVAEVLEQRPSCRVIALTKVPHPQKSHTTTAQGGLAAVDPAEPADKIIYHMFDTWKGSDCMADQNVVKRICEAAWEQIIWLENRGMHFSREQDGKLSKRTFGGHTLNFGERSAFRAVFEADRTGKGIMDTAWGESMKKGASFLNQCVVTELLFKNSRCVGVVAFMQKEGAFVRILSHATVLATGGSGYVFKITTNCRQNTGDGLANVLQAGLPVMDPEAVQFHPTGIIGPGILASETLRSVGGILRNKDNEAFMERYAPKMKDLAPRDMVSRAIETEILEGRGILNPDHQVEHVWIDLRHLPQKVHEEQIPEVSSFFKRYVNLDPQKELCPVRPSNHYHMGGIPTDVSGQVLDGNQNPIPGLYAIGECACASFHGFNRLGTNSILELITMGKFVGNSVLEFLGKNPQAHLEASPVHTFDRFSKYLECQGTGSTGQIRSALRALMTAQVGVFRTESSVLQAIESLKELKERSQGVALLNKSLRMNQELIERWELDNLLAVSMVIAQAALARKESRGAHFRKDFPERRDEFNHHTLASMVTFPDVTLTQRAVDMSVFNARGENYEKFNLIERKY